MRIAIVTGIWKRHNIFKMFAKGVKHIEENIKDVELITIVAGSEGKESKKLVESYGFHYIEMPNQPLSNKMQSTIKKAYELKVDYVICMGSDDVLSLELMQKYILMMKKGIDYIGTTDFYFYDTVSDKSLYWGGYTENYRFGHLCGAGRCLSANLLNQMNWMVWEGYDNMLDTSMQVKLKGCKYTEERINLKKLGLYALDIKSETNMTKFVQWNNSQFIDSDIIKNKFHYIW